MKKIVIEKIYDDYETNIDKIHAQYIKDIEEIYDRNWRGFNIAMCIFIVGVPIIMLIAFILGS